MKRAYEAVACLPDGTEADRLDFEYDVERHESFRYVSHPDPYLAVDAPGVLAFANRFIEAGYVEMVNVREAVLLVDESGIAKRLPLNRHPLARLYPGHLFGAMVVIRRRTLTSATSDE